MNTGSSAGRPFDRREATVVSVAIVLSALLYLPIPMGSGGRVLTLSIFDVVMVGLFFWFLYRRRLSKSSIDTASMFVAFVMIIYASAFWLLEPELQEAGLLREAIKCLGFIFGVIVCGFVVRFTDVLAPSPRLAACLGMCVLVFWLIAAHVSLSMSKHPLVINAYSNLGVCLAILALFCFRNRMDSRLWLGIVLYETAVLVLAAYLGAISMSVVSISVLALTLYAAARDLGHEGRPFQMALYLLLILSIASSVYFFWTGGIGRLETVHLRGSIAVRLGLWMQAVDLAIEHFPLGIGPGQFGVLDLSERDLIYHLPSTIQSWFGFNAETNLQTRAFGFVPIRYFHNTFFTLVVEWGGVGIGLALLLLILVWRVFKALPFPASICYAVYVVPTLLLNDGLGFRIHYLLLGIGISTWLLVDCRNDVKDGRQ